MISRQRVLRELTIRPIDLSKWSKVCRRVSVQVETAHPESPLLRDMQLMSYVKRLLPEIRAMIAAMDDDSETPDAT
jgi:hypothetical protein